MLWNGQPVAYVVLADPEQDRARGPIPNLPPGECKILFDSRFRPRLLLDMVALEQYTAQIGSKPDPFSFDFIWKAVRKGDAAALSEIPFLLSALETFRLIEAGQLSPQALDANFVSEPTQGNTPVPASTTLRGFRTGQKEMEDLALDWDDTYRESFSSAQKLGLLDYLLKWDSHIPRSALPDFYRGLCHGFRFVLDACVVLDKMHPNSVELQMLEELYLYLAGRAAECCLHGYVERSAVPASKLIVPMPGFMIANIVPPFQIESSEIEWLASQVEEEMLAKLAPLDGRASSKSSGKLPLDPMLEPGDSPSFYLGVVYATKLNEQVAGFYEAQILPSSLVQWTHLEEGAHQSCCIAACHYIEASRDRIV